MNQSGITAASEASAMSGTMSDMMIVTDSSGQRGTIETLSESQMQGGTPVAVRLDDGQRLFVPYNVLVRQSENAYTLPFALSEFLTSSIASEHQARVLSQVEADQGVVVPIIEEELTVGKRVVETGGVRINKTVQVRQETVDLPLIEDHAEVERVTVNRMVDAAPEVRHDGETLIVPILEEVLVVEKRLMLREELHIRLRRDQVHKPQQVTLRREEVEIERFAPGESTEDTPLGPV